MDKTSKRYCVYVSVNIFWNKNFSKKFANSANVASDQLNSTGI